MNNRKAISKKTRFEVFKRDNFTCQYCGRKAPDVILEVDHIQPVSKGGKNDILNLVTSCKDCNRGKSDRKISEHKELDIQREKLEELNERRNQLKMIKQWRDEINCLINTEIEIIDNIFFENTNFKLTKDGMIYIKNLIKQFGFDIVLESMEIYTDRYIGFKNNGYVYFLKPLSTVGGIAKNKHEIKLNPAAEYEQLFVIELLDQGIISPSEKWRAKNIIKGRIKNQEQLNFLTQNLDEIECLDDIDDYIYDLLCEGEDYR